MDELEKMIQLFLKYSDRKYLTAEEFLRFHKQLQETAGKKKKKTPSNTEPMIDSIRTAQEPKSRSSETGRNERLDRNIPVENTMYHSYAIQTPAPATYQRTESSNPVQSLYHSEPQSAESGVSDAEWLAWVKNMKE